MSPRRRKVPSLGCPRYFYKYRGIPPKTDVAGRRCLEALVLDTHLFFASSLDFKDPFDGKARYAFPADPRERRRLFERFAIRMGVSPDTVAQWPGLALADDLAGLEQQFLQNHAILQRHLGVCSLTADPRHPLMWSHYADGHQGICLQLDPTQDNLIATAQEVLYSDQYPVIVNAVEPSDGSAAVTAMTQKSSDWEYEQEWRVFTPGQAGIEKPFDAQALVGLVLGLRCEGEPRNYVLSLLDERERRDGKRRAVYQAEMARDRYRYRLKRVR